MRQSIYIDRKSLSELISRYSSKILPTSYPKRPSERADQSLLSLSCRARPSPNSAGVELSPSTGHVQTPLVDILTTSHRSVTGSEERIVTFYLSRRRRRALRRRQGYQKEPCTLR